MICSSSRSSSVHSSKCCKTKKLHLWNTNLGMKYGQEKRLLKPMRLFAASTCNTSRGFSRQTDKMSMELAFLGTQRQITECGCHSRMLQHVITDLKYRKTAIISIACVIHTVAREILINITSLTGCSELKFTYY